MPDNDRPRDERERLHDVCRRTSPAPMPDLLIEQVVRVLTAKLDAAQTLEIVDPAALFRAFVSLRLLSPRLLFLLSEGRDPEGPARCELVQMPRISASMAALLAKVMDGPARGSAADRPSRDHESAAQGLAVCFAASAYPQRVSQMTNTSLAWRVEAWLGEFLRLGRSDSGLPAVDRLPETVRPSDLLSALGGAGPHHHDSALRSNGAALYLASCYQEEIDRIVDVWRTEAPIVEFLRKWLPTPPSWTAGEDRLGRQSPDWGRVRLGLAEHCRGEAPGLVDQAIILEQMAWKASKQHLEPDMLMQSVQEIWERLWTRLTSGFPYYAFRSRFTWWWKQCLHHWFQRPSDPLIQPDKIDRMTADVPPRELAPETLRCVREGYRLVRTTFYAQRPKGGQGASPEHGGQSPRSREEIIDNNEKVRRIVDEIWSYRILCRVTDDAGEKQMVKDIAARFPEVRESTIDTYGRRLRLRLWAYRLARLERLSNTEILSLGSLSAEGARRQSHEVSWESVGAVPSIAALARAVPPEHTLLWAFATHVFLHDRVDPQHSDPWTSARFFRELWHWVNDEAFEGAVRQGSRDLSTVDGTAHETIVAPPFQDALCALRTCEDDRQAEGRIEEAESNGQLAAWTTAARDVLESFAGAGVLDTCDKAAFQKWKTLVGRENGHWIVPIWYLTVIEQVDEKQIRLRCQPALEAERLDALGRAIATRLRSLGTPAASAPSDRPATAPANGRRTP